MKIFTFISLIYFLFPLNDVEAGWRPASLKKIDEINQNYSKMGSGELVTAWGGWKRLNISTNLKGEKIKVSTGETKSGFIEAYFYKNHMTGRRPLFVYFPGIFGQVGYKMTDDFIQKLEALNGHLLVVPNFLSESWIQSQPHSDRHPAKTEIYLIAAIWKELNKRLPIEHISNTHIIGEGLGSLMASAWVSQMDFQPRPKTLTLLWPLAELDMALVNLDAYFESSLETWKNCSVIWTYPAFLRYFLLSSTPSGISEANGSCLGAWGAYKGVVKNLNNVSAAYGKVTQTPVIRPKNFLSLFENSYKPFLEVIRIKDETMHLQYWISSIKKNQTVDVRILTSYDDFLNKGTSIPEVGRKAGMDKKNIMVFQWGGHGGPMGTEEFKELLQLEFSE